MKFFHQKNSQFTKVIGCLFIVALQSCSPTLHPSSVRAKEYPIKESSQLVEDQKVLGILGPFKKQLDEKMNEVIGEVAVDLTKRQPESSLGNWMADAIHRRSEAYYGQKIDFVICNYGGLRIDEIPKGPLTKGKVFELMPFENRIVILTLQGSKIQELFDHMAENRGWPISYPVKYKIRQGKAEEISIDGKSIVPDINYRIGVSDFIANGNSGCTFLVEANREDLPYFFRESLMEFVEKETSNGKKLSAKIEGRVEER